MRQVRNVAFVIVAATAAVALAEAKDLRGQAEEAKRCGIYQGVVVDAADPANKRRVRLKVPELFGEQVSSWARVVSQSDAPYSPRVHDNVAVGFLGCNIDLPVVLGTFRP